MTRVLVIDNYDSFTYNLVDYIATAGAEVEVARNDRIDVEAAEAVQPTHVVVSPGPGTPAEAGVSAAVVERFAGRVPVLGVCLGHQCIGSVFGGRVVRTDVMHGKTSTISHDGRPGPGEIRIPTAPMDSASSTSMASLRRTTGSAPSSPRYWTRL